jgi:hypothetical protein
MARGSVDFCVHLPFVMQNFNILDYRLLTLVYE